MSINLSMRVALLLSVMVVISGCSISFFEGQPKADAVVSCSQSEIKLTVVNQSDEPHLYTVEVKLTGDGTREHESYSTDVVPPGGKQDIIESRPYESESCVVVKIREFNP